MRKLTSHETAILEAYTTSTSTEVAKSFGVMPQTVKETIQRVYYKLGVASKQDAIKVAREQGYEIGE